MHCNQYKQNQCLDQICTTDMYYIQVITSHIIDNRFSNAKYADQYTFHYSNMKKCSAIKSNIKNSK